MSSTLEVLTPEKSELVLNLAPLGARGVAHILDLMILTGLIQLLSTVLVPFGLIAPESYIAFTALAYFVLSFLYFIILEAFWQGQSLGKKIMRIRVVSIDGTAITFYQSLVRNLLRAADTLPALYLVGIVVAFLNPRGQRTGDIVAGTMVVFNPPQSATVVAAPHRYGVHHFEQYIGDLNNMSLDEYIAMKRLCDRYYDLPGDQQRLAIEQLWYPFAERHNIPRLPNVASIYLIEATIMKFSRMHGLL